MNIYSVLTPTLKPTFSQLTASSKNDKQGSYCITAILSGLLAVHVDLQPSKLNLRDLHSTFLGLMD